MTALTALNFWVSFVAGYTLANCNVICGIAQCIYTARSFFARSHTCSRLYTTMFIVGAIIVIGTAGCDRNRYDCTASIWSYSISIFRGTCATATFINDESTFKRAHAPSIFVHFQSFFNSAWNTIAINVNCRAWWAHTVSVNISYKSFILRTRHN